MNKRKRRRLRRIKKYAPLILITIIIVAILTVLIHDYRKSNSNKSQNESESPSNIDESKESVISKEIEEPKEPTEPTEPTEETKTEDVDEPAFNYINPEGMTAETRVKPPEGYRRIRASSGSFLDFVRKLDMKEDGSPVLLYDDNEKANQSAQVAVYSFDVGTRDLQQCADSIMRVYSEYYWSKGDYENIKFHLTNGFLMDYQSWRSGKRIKVDGNKVSWVSTSSFDDSYENFRKYLISVMAYAGTLSLDKESKTIEIADIKAGDMIIKGGSPGHCVLVVDIAENDQGDTCYLLSQGYMPAQEFHILKNSNKGDCPWYFQEDLTGNIRTPEYSFNQSQIKRWNNGL